MNEQRKRIIISEIKYWRNNKLLPEHYCDFLITLYAQGDDSDQKEKKQPDSILLKEKKRISRSLLFYSLLALVASASMFIISTYPVVTLLFAASVVLVLLLMTLRKTSTLVVTQFIYIITSFLLLGMSLKVWLTYFEGHTMLLLGLIMLNCVLWLFAGRLLKLVYFTISGTVGLLLVVGFLILSF
jgi:hypothetical protein